MPARRIAILLGLLFLCSSGVEAGQATGGASGGKNAAPVARATIREYTKVFRTYPFSDPNPIATVGRVYPYFRFDGYTDTPVDKRWTVIELENQYIRLTVMPEIGGKIWDAVEKSTGRSFIYNNHVVKFRDIALRGPWTSGGIEANYGIIGHTPNCATPVDYRLMRHQDGSVSVVIGVLDLLTRTPWRLEIALAPDKAYFTTRSFWFNQTAVEQPYYTWMNTGIKAAGNLELVYPGTHHLGHDGEVAPWPIDAARGKNLSFYEQNNFGPYKSYHVFGQYSDFFGAYWHGDKFGMGRYSTRDDKLGKKAWIWGLSRQGMIWERLLTDRDGQYVEVQSGRLFNQAAEGSTLTPFKHRGFAPYTTDTWTEYWFPVTGIGGFAAASDAVVLNVLRAGASLTLELLPLESLTETLEVFDGDTQVAALPLTLRAMRAWRHTLNRDIPAERLRVRLGQRLDYRPAQTLALARPTTSPSGFDWDSVFGLHLRGKEWIRQREYAKAQEALEASLRKDPNYLPALADLAMVRYMALDYQRAWELARRALAIDTYDPAANYYYGLSALALGKDVDARDGFEVAASSPEFRGAAWTELAKMRFRQGDLDGADAYARRSLDANPMNLDAWHLRALASRVRKDVGGAKAALAKLASLDALSHAGRFERAWLEGNVQALQAFAAGIRNEMPHETILEMAAWYEGLGRHEEALTLLRQAPAHAEALYWTAWIEARLGRATARASLQRAEQASPRLVLPFRSESAPVFEWAVRQGDSWKPRYYLALIKWSRNDLAGARALLAECGQAPDFAPFYAARAEAFEPVNRASALVDLEQAARMDPNEWRFGKLLAERLIEDGAYGKAGEVASRYATAVPASYILGMLRAKTLVLTGQYGAALEVLGRLNVMPYEGATDGRSLFRQANLLRAAEEFRAGRGDSALNLIETAREWPENLGAGKPYPENVDERLEDFLEARVLTALGREAEARIVIARLSGPGAARPGLGRLLPALAAAAAGRAEEAARLAAEWAAGERNPQVAEWGRRIATGEKAEFPAAVVPTDEQRVLLAWLGAGA
jgi:tetratricopeptide (TPR) repeat protein